MQTRPENRGELGSREALAAKRLPRSGMGGPRVPVCLRGGRWWVTGPARVPTVSIPRFVLERSEMWERGERQKQRRAGVICPSGRREAPAAEPLGAWHG